MYKTALSLANTLGDAKAIASIRKVMSGSSNEAHFTSSRREENEEERTERTKEGEYENKLVNHVKSSPERRSSEGIGLVDVPPAATGSQTNMSTSVTVDR